MASSAVRVGDEDGRSELGGLFESAPPERSQAGVERDGGGASRGGTPVTGVLRAAPAVARRVGRGEVPYDQRKFRYDRNRARTLPAVEFSASRADRMDAAEAGEYLDRIHVMYGIDRESEDVLAAFDKALFFEHTINGASLLQPGRGKLYVGDSEFELQPVKALLGPDQRRFFRAFADEIADVNHEVIAAYDPYNPVAAERYGQLMQVALARGLQKYPWLAHDSSDAGIRLSVEERTAVMASKRLVLQSTVNNVDTLVERPAPAGRGSDNNHA